MRRAAGLPVLMAIVSLLGGAWFVINVAKFHRAVSCQSDFLTFYAAGKLAFSGDLYDFESVRQVYAAAAGCPNFPLPFTRPAFYAALIKPLSMLPYPLAYRTWYFFCAVAILMFVWLWPGNQWLALAVCSWSFPLMSNFVYGQDGPFMLLITGAAVRFFVTAETKSAVLLTLGAAKIHLFAPAAIWVLAGSRWRIARTAAICGASLLALSFAAGGPNWIPRWVRAATSPAADGARELMLGTRSLGIAFGVPSWLVWSLNAVLAAAAFLSFRRMHPATGIALIPPIGIILAGHSFLYDAALCIPLILTLFEGDYPLWVQSLALAVAVPVVHMLPAPPELVLNAQWLLPLLVIAVIAFELTRPGYTAEETLRGPHTPT